VLAETLAAIRPPDPQALADARAHQDRLTKPRGSLGALEEVAVRLAGAAGSCPPPMPEPAALAIFAADHGVHARGVSPWPQEVTTQMVANFTAGGAVANAFAAQVGASVTVVDVGVAADLPDAPNLLKHKIGYGTADLSQGPAMTVDQAVRALEAGIIVARGLIAKGARCLITGDMGIANTTASAALVAAFTGTSVGLVTGRGTGVDDETLSRKVEVIAAALLERPVTEDPVETLASLGGFEHAAIAGFVLGAAGRGVPVILDGLIAGAAALVAQALAAESVRYCFAGHRSVEPGHLTALCQLGLRPLVDLDLRLGEGSGAALAVPLVQAAARILAEMATFDSAGVANKDA
jgi:nicotinate-nucleotide--dimethylbenzimidazole phosphoribosyltransferase